MGGVQAFSFPDEKEWMLSDATWRNATKERYEQRVERFGE